MAALSVGLLVSAAQAATVNYSTSSGTVYNNASGTLNLPKFDSSLGTLTGISITETITVNGSATVTAPGVGSPLFVNAATLRNTGTVTGTGLTAYSARADADFITSTVAFAQNEQQTYTLTEAIGTKTVTVGSGYFGSYTGAGNAAFNYIIGTTFLSDTSGGFSMSSSTASNVGVSVTYTYIMAEIPMIPEPNAYAALFGGVVLLGALRRRLRNNGPSPSLPAV